MDLRLFKDLTNILHKSGEVSLLLDSGKVVTYTTSTTLSSGEVRLTSANGKNKLTLPRELDKICGIQPRLIA